MSRRIALSSIKGYLGGALKDWSYPSVKERVELGHRKHFKAESLEYKKTRRFKKIQVVNAICCLDGFGRGEKG